MTTTASPASGSPMRLLALLSPVLLAPLAVAALRDTPAATSPARPPATAPAAAEMQALVRATHDDSAPPVEGVGARALNEALPFAAAPRETAAGFQLPARLTADDRLRAERCLTEAIYYEAGFEPVEGRRAVAQVVLNRLRHPAFPKTVCGVVFEGATAPGCQFSFACDGSMRRAPVPAAWTAARQIAREALAGRVVPGVGQATHYHADYVFPRWAPKLAKVAQIGPHIFYRWPGGWGLRRAFTGRHAGYEALPVATAEAPPPLPPRAIDERRAANDVGGRLDVSKAWRLSFADPAQGGSALAATLAEQSAPGAADTQTLAEAR